MSRSTTWKTTSGRLTRAARCAWTWSRRPLTTAVSSCSRHVLVSRSESTPRCSDITTSPWNLAHAACADTQPTASSQRHQHEAETSTVVLYQCRPTLGVLHQQLTRRAPHRHQQGSHTATSFLLLLLYTHTFNGPFSGTNQVSRYQKGKTNLDYTEAGDSEWQWHQLGHMQVCILLQTDNHASTPPLSFFTGRMPFLPPNQQRQSTEGCYYYTQGEITSPNLWARYDRHFVGVTWQNVWS